MYLQPLVAVLAVLGLTAAAPESARQARNERHGRHRHLDVLNATGLARLLSLGMGSVFGVPATGKNAESEGTEGVWIGTDGPYTMRYTNRSPYEIVLVVWGDQPEYQASFVKAVQPLITVSLRGGNDTTVLSFANGQSGAFAGVYPDTALTVDGQISQTWGEFTMSPTGVVDISREVYSNGNSLSIAGPDCTTNMDTCVFKCTDASVTTCWTAGSYQLENCSAGSQRGAQSGDNGESGGCGWLGASQANFHATFY